MAQLLRILSRHAAALLLAAPFAVQAVAQSQVERCRSGAAAGDVASCAAATAEQPQNPELRRLYAQSLSKAADYEGAVREYREVTRLTPQDARAFHEFAGMLAFVRRYAEAVPPIEEAIRLRPDHAPTYRSATIIYHMVKQPAAALRMAVAGAQLGDPIAMFDAYAYYAEGVGLPRDERQAFAWLVKAAEAGHVGAMDRLATLFLNGGLGQKPDDRQAEAWATRARLARAGKL